MLFKDALNRKEAYWIMYIKRRIKLKKNFLGFISGPTGSGKSWAGLSICGQCDKDFTSTRIVTDMEQLMDLINSKSLTSGSAILWDEAGIAASSKTWQSLQNRLINFLMQTFRHKRFILIFTSPYLDYIDASTRKMFHAEFQTTTINYDKKECRLKCQMIQYNSRMRKFYYKYMRIKNLQGRTAILKYWNVKRPSMPLIEEYEEVKTKFTTALNKDITKQLKEEGMIKSKEKQPLTQIQEKVLRLMAIHNDVPTVAKEMGVHITTIYFHIGMAKKKMWKIEDFEAPK